MSGSVPALGYVEGRGYYDRAGRRLFLIDGSPDPDSPGAYRYRSDPDSCDSTAPESDPANPRFEPPHLRHRPGGTWEIGGEPADPDDPGPYGSRGWYQDTRTGRHRRNELPDPPEPEADTRASDSRTYRFDRLREDAWDHFMTDSAPLAASHHRSGRAARLLHADVDAKLLVTEYLPGSLVQGTSAAAEMDTYEQAGELLREFHDQFAFEDPDYEPRMNAKALTWMDGRHRIEPEIEGNSGPWCGPGPRRRLSALRHTATGSPETGCRTTAWCA